MSRQGGLGIECLCVRSNEIEYPAPRCRSCGSWCRFRLAWNIRPRCGLWRSAPSRPSHDADGTVVRPCRCFGGLALGKPVFGGGLRGACRDLDRMGSGGQSRPANLRELAQGGRTIRNSQNIGRGVCRRGSRGRVDVDRCSCRHAFAAADIIGEFHCRDRRRVRPASSVDEPLRQSNRPVVSLASRRGVGSRTWLGPAG